MKLALLFFTAMILQAQQGWWMTEPIRLVQTNLRETDAAVDPRRLVEALSSMHANVVLTGMGGSPLIIQPKSNSTTRAPT